MNQIRLVSGNYTDQTTLYQSGIFYADAIIITEDIEDEMIRQAEIYYDEVAAGDAFYAKVIKSQRAFKKAIREAYTRL